MRKLVAVLLIVFALGLLVTSSIEVNLQNEANVGGLVARVPNESE